MRVAELAGRVPGADTPSAEFNHFLEAYEAAQARTGAADLDDFVPPVTHPLRSAVLPELIRIDLEYRWERGDAIPLEEYRRRFPDLFADAKRCHELAFEEYRLRLQAGERPTPQEYGERYGISTTDWPEFAVTIVTPTGAHVEKKGPPTADLADAARTYQQNNPARARGNDSVSISFAGPREHAELFEDLHRADPRRAKRLAEAVTTMPKAGEQFLGFRLVSELGRGAFGRVFLAEQENLAQRRVALKVCADLRGESQTLAQLLHTNVMPIYSLHRSGPFQAVCMPYYGSTTLADVLREFKDIAMPASGRQLVSTLRNSRTVGSTSRSAGSSKSSRPNSATAVPISAAVEKPEPKVGSRVILDMLERRTYVEAMLWIASRLADGLAHAHERGILHRDLKPANVLLSDEGQPLLLDFNLAEDTKLRDGASLARIGGTLPYMSPEQLWAMQGEPIQLDGRSDIFALGLILYELLTGAPPWPIPLGPTREVVRTLVEQRRSRPEDLRKRNPAISPAVEAIVLKCLEPEAGRRYQTARALQEDLERQLHDQPLVHAPEPSRRERMRKFSRRHPRLCSTAVIGTAAALLLAAVAGVAGLQAVRLKQRDVLDRFHAFQDDVKEVQLLLTAQSSERAQWEEAVARGKQALAPYGVLDDERWQDKTSVRYLPAAEQEALRDEVGMLLFMMTRAQLQRPGGDDRQQTLVAALDFNTRAEACFGPRLPASFLSQRSEALNQLGRGEEASRLRDKIAQLSASSQDRILAAREHVAQGRYGKALPILQQVAHQEPQNMMAWFLLARCHDDLGQDAQAVACYNTCIALWPQSYRLAFNRGLAYLRQRDFARAVADFDRSLTLEPNQHDGYFNRGLALQGLGRHADAITDYTKALDQGAPYTRVYFVRARARDQVKDADGARRDREEGMRLEPTDERSWVARGMARLSTEPARALADFEKALEVNPHYRPALENKAYVLAEIQGKNAEAVQVLDRILELYPDQVASRSSRGVLLARLGQRGAALADAEDALSHGFDPAIQYQVAGVFAQTSRTHPDDAKEAVRLLAGALRRGYGLDLVPRDPDLDPLRESQDFRRVVEAARALQK